MTSQQTIVGLQQIKQQNHCNPHSRSISSSNQFMSQFLSQKPLSSTRDNSLNSHFNNNTNHNNLNLLNSIALSNQCNSKQNQNKQNQKQTQNSNSAQQQSRKDRNFSASDLHQMCNALNQGPQINNKSQCNIKKAQNTQSPSQQNIFQSNTFNQLSAVTNGVQFQSMKQDNIQKAIDNLKTFIKGSFPINTIQQSKMNNNKIQNAFQGQKQILNVGRQLTNNPSKGGKQRELSEDPHQMLAASFFHKLNKEVQNQSSDDEEEKEEKRRNPHEPIPAFTSLEVAKKLRYRSEDRYVNDRMEKELIAYKAEIEKRYQKSNMKDFTFPRIQTTQTPVFFSNTIHSSQNNQKRDQPQQVQTKYKMNSVISIQNKENIHQDKNMNNIIVKQQNSSPQSPYGYKGESKTSQIQPSNSYSINDYKRILSQFLSTSIPTQGKQSQTNNNNKISTNQQQITVHQRSQSSGLHQSCSMLSQRVLANAKQTINDQMKSKNNNASKKHTASTFVEKHNLPQEDEDQYQNHHYYQQTEAVPTIIDHDDFAPIQIEEFNGLEQYQSQNLLQNIQMKTFDNSYKDSVVKQSQVQDIYLSKGFQTSESQLHHQKARKEQQNEGMTKKSSGIFRESNIDHKIQGIKNINKAAEYFKTFYQKPKNQKSQKYDKARNTINNTSQNYTNELSNPFVTITFTSNSNNAQQITENSSKKPKSNNKSISSKINQPQLSQVPNNPFSMQVNLKSLVADSQKQVTRNNKLSQGSGMHVRAKTTSDFDDFNQPTEHQTSKPAKHYEPTQVCSINIEAQVKNSFINKNVKKNQQDKCSNQPSKKANRREKKAVAYSRAQNSDELKSIQSLKLQKSYNNQILEAKLTNGLTTDRNNPYQHQSNGQYQQQSLYSHREMQRHVSRRNDSSVNSSCGGLTRSSCPYSDNGKVENQSQSSIYDLNGTGNQSNLKNIFSSFSHKTNNSAKTSGRKTDNLAQMARSNSKRDFKVKCMKIDLSKKLEYCTTENS